MQVTTIRATPVLSVVPASPVVAPGEVLRFYLFTNYSAFIDHAELRIFRDGDSVEGTPVTAVPVRFGEPVSWMADARDGRLRAVLRVYDAKGRFDETAPQEFSVTSARPDGLKDRREGPSFENQRTTGNITVTGTEVTVSGSVEDPAARLLVFGAPVPIDRQRHFVVQQIVPSGTDAVTVRLEKPGGEAREFRRVLNVPKQDNFFVGIADLTAGHRSFDDAKLELQGVDAADPRKDFVDGRFAFYLKSQLSEKSRLTASADTGEHPVSDLFDGFLKEDFALVPAPALPTFTIRSMVTIWSRWRMPPLMAASTLASRRPISSRCGAISRPRSPAPT